MCRNQCKLHDFFQPYETSSVITINFCTNKNEDQWSEAQTLPIFLCNLGLRKIKQFLSFNVSATPHYITGPLCLVADYIQKRRGEPGLFSFEYNLLPNLMSK